MKRETLAEVLADNKEGLSKAARANLPERAAKKRQMSAQMAAHPKASVREATYKGRKLRIETSYKISVDGQPVQGHVMVGHDGRVHYHSIPNQEFPSAVDMVKRIIDLTPTPTTYPKKAS